MRVRVPPTAYVSNPPEIYGRGSGMGTRAKNNPPRRRGPPPERLVLPGPWEGAVEKALKKPPPPKKKGRGK